MLYHPYVKSEWIISREAKKFYSICAIVALFCYLGVLLSTVIALTAASEVVIKSALLGVFLESILFVGVLAAAIIWVAMWYFWFRFGIEGKAGGALWFLAMVVLGPIGALLYFVVVYRRMPLPSPTKEALPA